MSETVAEDRPPSMASDSTGTPEEVLNEVVETAAPPAPQSSGQQVTTAPKPSPLPPPPPQRKLALISPTHSLLDTDNLPALLPEQIAAAITVVSTTARLSLRLSAFLVTAFLDVSQFTGRVGLDYTRRMLVSAVSAAKNARNMKTTATDELLAAMGLVPASSDVEYERVLDRFTGLGVYWIHSAFSLAEMFTMAGFNLTSKCMSGGYYVAQESVALFNNIFGSSESSKALAAIISLVKREFDLDYRYNEKKKGKLWSLKLLTKALTAFVCLQNMTWKTTSKSIKYKLIYDCTVVESTAKTLEPASQPLMLEASAVDPVNIEAAPTPDMSSEAHDESGPSPEVAQPADVDIATALTDIMGEASNESEAPLVQSGDDNPALAQDSSERGRRRLGRSETLDEMGELPEIFVPQRHHSRHRRTQSDMLPSEFLRVIVPLTPEATPSPSERGVGDEWIEVDSNTEALSDLPSIPNGRSYPRMTRSNTSASLSSPSDRMQLVMRGMTERLKSRRKITRRIPSDEAVNSLETPETKRSRMTRSDVRSIPWTASLGSLSKSSAAPATSNTTASPTLIRSRVRGLFTGRAEMQALDEDTADIQMVPSLRLNADCDMPVIDAATAVPLPVETAEENADEVMEDLQGSTMPPAPPSSPASEARSRNSREDAHTNRVDSKITEDTRDRTSAPTADGSIPVIIATTDGITSETPASASPPEVTVTKRDLPQTGTDSIGQLYPHDTLTNNIARFMRFSSAVYGHTFIRLLGLGTSECVIPEKQEHHANVYAFAHHTNLPTSDIKMTSFSDDTPIIDSERVPLLVHSLAVDRAAKAVVLTCRGTLGLSDVLIDLTCDYCNVEMEDPNPYEEYFAHSGMYKAAINLTSPKSQVHQAIVEALNENPEYGLVVTGHSLGGGVAGLLSIISSMPADKFLEENKARASAVTHPMITTPFVTSFKSLLPAGRPIHCYTYGIPAVASPDLAAYSKGLITSVVHNTDIVPTLSLGILRDLKYAALTLHENGGREEEIVTRAIGLRKGRLEYTTLEGEKKRMAGDSQDEMKDQWMLSHIKTLRAGMQCDKLLPPGDVYIIDYQSCPVPMDPAQADAGSKEPRQAHRVTLHKCETIMERFREPLFTKTMLNDHLPTHYEKVTQLLVDGLAMKERAGSVSSGASGGNAF